MKTLTKTFAICCGLLGPAALAAECPLGPVGKALLAEAAKRNRMEAAWIINQSSQGGFPSRGFGRNLIGSTHSHTGTFTLIQQCTAPAVFDQYCDVCESGQDCPTLRRCSQLACEQALVDTVKLWWEPAPFRYTSDQPDFAGYAVRYLERPATFIRFDGRNPDLLRIDWVANDTAKVRRSGGWVSASSFLVGQGRRTPQGPQSADVNVFYPALAKGRAMIFLSLHIDQHGVVSGAVRADSRIIANIAEAAGGDVTDVQWQGECK